MHEIYKKLRLYLPLHFLLTAWLSMRTQNCYWTSNRSSRTYLTLVDIPLVKSRNDLRPPSQVVLLLQRCIQASFAPEFSSRHQTCALPLLLAALLLRFLVASLPELTVASCGEFFSSGCLAVHGRLCWKLSLAIYFFCLSGDLLCVNLRLVYPLLRLRIILAYQSWPAMVDV